MIYDVEHLFICLFAICISSFMRCQLRSLLIFKLGCLFSYRWVLRVIRIFWIIVLYQMSFLVFFLLLFVCLGFFNYDHPYKCEVMPYCGFDLHFSDDKWCWASFHTPIGHWYVFFGKMSIQILCSFLNQIFFLLLRCRRFLNILDISPLSDTWLVCKHFFFPFRRLPFHSFFFFGRTVRHAGS